MIRPGDMNVNLKLTKIYLLSYFPSYTFSIFSSVKNHFKIFNNQLWFFHNFISFQINTSIFQEVFLFLRQLILQKHLLYHSYYVILRPMRKEKMLLFSLAFKISLCIIRGFSSFSFKQCEGGFCFLVLFCFPNERRNSE